MRILHERKHKITERQETPHRLAFYTSLACLAALFPSVCRAQTYLPQIADGGDWYTTVVIVNPTASAASASLSFYSDTGSLGATVPWNPPFQEVSSTLNLAVPTGGTLYLHTAGTAAALTQGWAQVTGSPGIAAFAIYTYQGVGGRPNQDGTSQATTSATRIVVPFDATAGYSTGVAIVNPTAAAETVLVNLQTDAGVVTRSTIPTLPTNGQVAFDMAAQFPSLAGHRGLAEFYVMDGSLSIAAFRINPTIALTSVPVLLASGPPVIGSSSPGGSGGNSGPFTSFTASELEFQPAGFTPGSIFLSLNPNAGSVTYSATIDGGLPTFTDGAFSAGGLAFSANALQPSTASPPYGLFLAPDGGLYQVSGASLSFSLTPTFTAGTTQFGSISGTLSIQGTPYPSGPAVTLSGSISGTYQATLSQTALSQ